MNRRIVLWAAIACCAAYCAHADYGVEDRGTWPKSWPQELEPLRKQSRTLEGSLANIVFYEIPFTKREEFEAAWPHLLKIKGKGVPIILVRSPDSTFGKFSAGVRIKCPPRDAGNRKTPSTPNETAKANEQSETELTNIQLVVDGEIVNLNRISLPPDTPIIDERFKNAQDK